MWFQNLVAVTQEGKLLSFVAYLGFTCLIAVPVFVEFTSSNLNEFLLQTSFLISKVIGWVLYLWSSSIY